MARDPKIDGLLREASRAAEQVDAALTRVSQPDPEAEDPRTRGAAV